MLPLTARLQIHVHETPNNAVESMAFDLAKYDCHPRSTVSTGDQERTNLGNYCVVTRQSVLFVQGNLFVSLTFMSSTPLEHGSTGAPGSIPAAIRMAGSIYDYLRTKSVLREQLSS